MNPELELIENVETENLQHETEKKSVCCSIMNCKWCNLIALSVLFVAVIVLYVLHFIAPKAPVFTPKEIVGEPGSGEIVYVNLDTVNAQYELVAILTGDIKMEMSKQEAIFANRENAFQRKYKQFQENMNSGILTQVQMENAQTQLMQEYQQLEDDKERIFNNLQSRQSEALLQVYDSLQAAVKRINMTRNASFVITYQNQSPFLLTADPTKDITDYVLFELNRSYKK
ncbi:MAG: OmpH family outer membrane protein [Bacteroidetes bacterium]|nr:OmpH family outer membrane protein [Bacteroidota bacterium]MCL1969299.1 OmpH family outer membrane protein [Bacteroidota bacterium]